MARLLASRSARPRANAAACAGVALRPVFLRGVLPLFKILAARVARPNANA